MKLPYGCSDGTTTGCLKLATRDVVEKVLPYTGHTPVILDLPG